MAKKKSEPQLLKEGNVVEIITSTNENMRGCKGEVITTDPLTIAVVHVLPFDAKQVKKIFDAADFDWNELRRKAMKLDIPAKGTRSELEVKIKEQLKDKGRVEKAAAEPAAEADEPMPFSAPPVAATTKFKKNQFVKVRRDEENPEYVGARGTVIDPGPPLVDVKLLASRKVGTKPVRREYPEGDLVDDS